ncbi:MAG: IS200/IS605 family transposase [Fibrella sp.]|nr:IS200/IS605 family transposase [Armatimonadota bacterium]
MREEGALSRRRSRVEIYLHFVWATKYRAETLTPEFERRIHRCIAREVQGMGCSVLAIGGMLDHVHIVVRMAANRMPMELVKQAKGASGKLYNSIRAENSEPFHWQDGYGCFSLWYTQVDKAVAYVHNQKERHCDNNLLEILEQFDEPAPDTKTIHEYIFPDN